MDLSVDRGFLLRELAEDPLGRVLSLLEIGAGLESLPETRERCLAL